MFLFGALKIQFAHKLWVLVIKKAIPQKRDDFTLTNLLNPKILIYDFAGMGSAGVAASNILALILASISLAKSGLSSSNCLTASRP